MSKNMLDNTFLEKYPSSNKVIGIKTKSYIKNHNKDSVHSACCTDFKYEDEISNCENTLNKFFTTYLKNTLLSINNITLEEYPSSNKVIGIKTKSYLERHNLDILDDTYFDYYEYEEEMSKYEKVIEHFKENKKKYQLLVVLVALLIPSSTLQAYALASKTGTFTIKVYKMGKDIGKIICAIGVIAESSKCVLTGSVDQLGKIGVKYLSFGLLIRYLEDIISWVFN